MERLCTMKLDFSQSHFLDHWPFTPYCWSLPGGCRRHLRYAWLYRWRGRTVCGLGFHDDNPYWSSPTLKRPDMTGPPTGRRCWYCRREAGPVPPAVKVDPDRGRPRPTPAQDAAFRAASDEELLAAYPIPDDVWDSPPVTDKW